MHRLKTRSITSTLTVAGAALLVARCTGGCADDGGGGDGSEESGGADSGDSGTADSGGPVELALLDCPSPGALPFETMVTELETEAGQEAAMNPRIKDEASDLLGVPGGVFGYTTMAVTEATGTGALLVEGKKARTTPDMGLNSIPVPGEWVSLWSWDGSAWSQLDRVQTDEDGDYAFTGLDATVDTLQPYYSVLEGDGTCAAHYMFLLSTDTPIIVTDIDATLTESDGELFMQASNGDYDPLEKAGASQLANAWAD